ncbi:MAG: hypothetical protein EOO68_10145 [Moraxellaceae bacterium]|nr:MAG: hypothetical protein EOO68_10145 [Moraxellaceae bacterium]
MNRLDLCPLQSSYSAEFGDGVLSQDLAKGMPRTRADFIGAVHMVNASFMLAPDDYNYIMAFYRVYQRNPQPFLVGLYLRLFFKSTGDLNISYLICGYGTASNCVLSTCL